MGGGSALEGSTPGADAAIPSASIQISPSPSDTSGSLLPLWASVSSSVSSTSHQGLRTRRAKPHGAGLVLRVILQ